MSSIEQTAKNPTKWLIATLATLFSAVSNVAVIWISAGGIFRQSFGELRFTYYCAVVVAIAFAIYVVSIGYSNRPVIFFASPAIAAYVASVASYFSLATPSLVKMVRAHHGEVLIFAFILPYHLFFVVGGVTASLLMFGFFVIYGSIQRNNSMNEENKENQM